MRLVPHAGGVQDRPQGFRCASLAPDDAAHVAFGNLEVHVGCFAFLLDVDKDFFRSLDQRFREVFNQDLGIAFCALVCSSDLRG